mgnify:FL=1
MLEGHRKYIDVHILLEGKETIGWTPLCKALCKHKDYDEAKDYLLYTDTPSVFIDVNPGEFVIVYPEDLHAPGIGDGKIRKLVAKVLLDS